jgi:16S rRNA U1498 N3-methylase RsmE
MNIVFYLPEKPLQHAIDTEWLLVKVRQPKLSDSKHQKLKKIVETACYQN